jgi:cell volume regulation protein A
MPFEPLGILTLLGVTIVLGYVGSLIFKKTRVPDVVWLLLFGLLVGPIFGFVDRDAFITASPLLGAIALLIILFDAGLHMNLYQIMKKISRSIIIAFLGILLSTIGVALISTLLFNFDITRGLILGIIVGGTSSAVVISIVDPLLIKDGIKTILKLESIITDPVIIVLAIALMQIAVATAQPTMLFSSLVSMYSVAIVIGFIIGIVWLVILDKIKGKGFDYMLTLAIAFLLYVLVESIGGSGSISALVFGLVLGNSIVLSRMLRFEKRYRVDHLLKEFQAEIAFFIRSFFFVYLGLIATINFTYVYYGILITLVIIVMRFVVVELGTYKMAITKIEKNVMISMIPRGLAAAVLAQLPLSLGIEGGEIFLNVSFVVILLTVLGTTILTRICYKPEIEAPKEIKLIKQPKIKRKTK